MLSPGLNLGWHGAAVWMVVNTAIALLLGWFVGYERYFSGRAAGSQVYCLVCATSCAVTLLAGYPALWYGARSKPSPTRIRPRSSAASSRASASWAPGSS
uniref:MgtC/SapB family protein n=1 Tax=Variovorax brevis TaxID=3053503 RepID=UPI003365AF54